tara:strand:- start:2846 stop:3124 length:279 start_codon:yes stop_codon:yes gene_type:complete
MTATTGSLKMADQPWHLSKSIPITFIFAIIMQTLALVWFVATLSADTEANTRGLAALEDKTESLETIVHGQDVTLGRIDENIKTIQRILEGQ